MFIEYDLVMAFTHQEAEVLRDAAGPFLITLDTMTMLSRVLRNLAEDLEYLQHVTAPLHHQRLVKPILKL